MIRDCADKKAHQHHIRSWLGSTKTVGKAARQGTHRFGIRNRGTVEARVMIPKASFPPVKARWCAAHTYLSLRSWQLPGWQILPMTRRGCTVGRGGKQDAVAQRQVRKLYVIFAKLPRPVCQIARTDGCWPFSPRECSTRKSWLCGTAMVPGVGSLSGGLLSLVWHENFETILLVIFELELEGNLFGMA